jgi:repressor LexA
MRDSERKTLAFIQKFVASHGFSPKLHEICEGIGIRSKGTVSRYIQALIDEGHLGKEVGKSRGLTLLSAPGGSAFRPSHLPLMGMIAAGKPIEAISNHETLDFTGLMGENMYALKVRGFSMQDEGILDGDFVICHAQSTANDGDIVVALIDGEEVTLKRLYWENRGQIKLVPANTSMVPLVIDAQRVQIQGVFKALLRVKS